MGRITNAIMNHIEKRHNLKVTVYENEGIVSMSKETYEDIIQEYGQLLWSCIWYFFMTVTLIIVVPIVIFMT